MGTRPTDDGGSRRRIVDAATAEFGAQGFDGARMDAIAARAGVNKALLYYYFANKRELYRGILFEHFDAIRGALEAAAARPASDASGLSSLASVREVIRALVGALEERPHFPAFILREFAHGSAVLEEDEFRTILRAALPVRMLVNRGIADGELREVPSVFVHLLIVGALNFYLLTRPVRERVSSTIGDPDLALDVSAFAEFLADTLERGVAAHATRPEARPTGGPPR